MYVPPGPGSLYPTLAISPLFLAFTLSSNPGSATRTLNKVRSTPHPLLRNVRWKVESRQLLWVGPGSQWLSDDTLAPGLGQRPEQAL